MRGLHAANASRHRALKAVVIVMALLLAVPGVNALLHVAGVADARGFAAGGIDSRLLADPTDAFASLERIEQAARADEASVPDAFYEEVGVLPGAHDIRANGSGTVVGYLATGRASDVLDTLTAHMESSGFTAVMLGEVQGATFVKASGAYAWVLATCTQVGQETSVVIRSASI